MIAVPRDAREAPCSYVIRQSAVADRLLWPDHLADRRAWEQLLD